MYDLPVSFPENRAPWLISFEERLSEFAMSLSRPVKRIIALYDKPNTTSFRYRVYNIKQILQDDNEIQFFYFYRDELEKLYHFLPKIDIFLLSRCQWTLEIQKSIDIVKSHKIPLVFDIDDLFCSLEYLQLITNTLNVQLKQEFEYDWWTAAIGRTYMVACQADILMATNPYLLNKLSSVFADRPGFVIDNSINHEQLDISNALLECKNSAVSNDEFVIGYFSGTPSHINDFNVIADDMLKLLNDFPSMKLKVVGFMEFPERMKSLIENGRIEFHPLVDFIELQKLMAEVDVNVAPLVENDFTNCKSELKFFEAAIVNTITCATPIYTYKTSIKHGESGFLCKQGEWYSTIANIYNGKYDLNKITSNARDYCLNRYCGENFRNQVKNVFSEILTKHTKQSSL